MAFIFPILCSIGINEHGEIGPAPDNDGLDTDSDGFCNVGDLDDDNDGVIDVDDNCPIFSNPDQLDSNANGIGDACETIQNDGFCFPIKASSGAVAVICL